MDPAPSRKPQRCKKTFKNKTKNLMNLDMTDITNLNPSASLQINFLGKCLQ